MKVLVLGSGGREHALVWKLSQSPKVDKIYAIPGNPGIAEIAECVNLPLDDLGGLAYFAEQRGIDLTVVGPEQPLVDGIADVFAKKNLAVFGPCGRAAMLEGSKAFAKKIMEKNNIPTAFFAICHTAEEAKAYIKKQGAPIVVKADGLAAGKGVVVAMTEAEALQAVDDMMGKHKFGVAGACLVLEEYMEGEEASLLAFTDGENVVPMIAAQDHKRVGDGDKGPNTGGMGAYAPAPVMTEALRQKCMDTILKPVVDAMRNAGYTYKGCLYAGLMIKGDSAKVVEFNARFGDPETQPVLSLLDGDLAEIMLACARGGLTESMVRWSDKAAVCVVMTAAGYPEKYPRGMAISGIKDAEAIHGVKVFHAGTTLDDDNVLRTSGGRVLGVTAIGADIAEAQQKAYAAVDKISFESEFHRKDIAWRALK